MKTSKQAPKLTLAERIAKKHHATVRYVNQIMSGERTPTRGKGLAIAQDIEAVAAAQDAALQS